MSRFSLPASPAGREPGTEPSAFTGAWAQLRTARLALSAVAESDLEDFHRLHHDERVYQHVPLARHPDREHSASIVADIAADWARDGLGYWSVRSVEGSTYLGVGGVRRAGHLDRRGEYRDEGEWNVYYRFWPESWGHGYASETIWAAAECCAALDEQALLVARTQPANSAARRVAERVGLKLTHTELGPDGEPRVVYQATAASVARTRPSAES